MKKLFIILILFVNSMAVSYAQTNEAVTTIMDDERTARLDSLINDLFIDDPELKSLLNTNPWKMHYLYFRSSFSTKTVASGREIGDDQINIGNQLFYLNGAGFYAGVSGVWYNQLDPGYRTTILMGGYSNKLFNWDPLRVRLSYLRYISHIDDPLYEPLYKQALSSGFTLSNKHVGLRLDGSLHFGDYETGKSLSADLYGNLVLYENGYRKKIRFRPEISVTYGIDYQEFMLDESFIDPITGYEYTSYYIDKFGLMDVQLELPIDFRYKNFDFELSYKYHMPQNFVDDVEHPNLSVFQFSVGYFFRLGK
nr:hypothetical protein [uncultured Draconibacterium sp.]